MIGTFVMKELIRLTSERLRGVFNVHLKNIVHIDYEELFAQTKDSSNSASLFRACCHISHLILSEFKQIN